MRSSSTKTCPEGSGLRRATVVVLLVLLATCLIPAPPAAAKGGGRAALPPAKKDREAEIALWMGRLEEAKRERKPERWAPIARKLAGLHAYVGRYREARQYLEDALGWHVSQDEKGAIVETRTALGIVCESQGDYTMGSIYLGRALEEARKIGHRRCIAMSLSALGVINLRLGEYVAALEYLEEALVVRNALGNKRGRAATLSNIGIARLAMGEYEAALECFTEALEIQQLMRLTIDQARTLADIAGAHERLGAYATAAAHLKRARRICETCGHRSDLAAILSGLGNVHVLLGDYAAAIRYHEQAVDILRELGQRQRYAVALGNLGAIHESIGGTQRALELHEQALAVYGALGDRAGEAAGLRRVGALHGRLGRHEHALSFLERALRVCRELLDESAEVLVLCSLGNANLLAGQLAAAKMRYEHALELAEKLGDRAQIAGVKGNLGLVYLRLGEAERALELQEEALEIARELGLRRTVLLNRWGIALARLSLEEPAAAREQVLLAAEEIDASVAGLDDLAGPDAREVWAGLFDVGVLAAVDLDDVEHAFGFMESGRARNLLDALGGRGTLAALTLPPELAEAEARARSWERRALLAHRDALRRRKVQQIKRCAGDLEAARAQVAEVIARAQREARAASDIVYPEPPSLDAVQERLGEHDVLLEYAIVGGKTVALVVTKTGRRIVDLGSARAVREACDALRPERPESKPAKAIVRLRELVILPLDLPRDAERLLVSPHDALSYVPMALLAPGLDVAYVPSAASYVLLGRLAEERGEAVLALGDPHYRVVRSGSHRGRLSGRPLPRLPATRDEARAVGDRVLLGREASVSRFFEVLGERKRWRAVHFACHGFVDAVRPFDSALALSPTEESDGYLTALDLLGHRVPADLSVLSGCETGRGRLYRAEGIVGLTRAFMFAGSPRVLCSLWKVDDDATRALMTRFYELWNPRAKLGDAKQGLSAAMALRRAQEYVRAQKEWRHPYYWAAWVLWGLPD